MNLIDKSGRLREALQQGYLHLELGCGERKRAAEAVGVDVLDAAHVDVVGDLYTLLADLPDGCVDLITSYHCLEHLPDVPRVIEEIGRVLKPLGRCSIVVPHFSNPYFASDATHRTPFGLYTMSYFAIDTLFQRRVPSYQRRLRMTLQDVRLEFKACRPFYCRFAIKRVLSFLVNQSRYLQEFYEENLTGVLPCYELRFELVKQPYPERQECAA